MTMAKRNEEYWIKRQSQLFNAQLKKDDEFYQKTLVRSYSQQERKVKSQLSDFYAKYGEDNVIKYRDMLQGLSANERDEFFKQHTQFKDDHPELADLINLDVPIYQLNRLEALELSIQQNMLELGLIEQEAFEKHLKEAYETGYLKTMEILDNPQAMFRVSDELIQKTMTKNWVAGCNFSDSIWSNKEGLERTLVTKIRDGFIRGDSYESMIKMLDDRFDVGKFQARRLVQTEAAYIFNQANAQAFQDEGILKYGLSAVLDDRTSDICNAMDGEVFNFKDIRVGENAPPFHAFCRTMIIPIENDVQLTKDNDLIESNLPSGITQKLNQDETEFYDGLLGGGSSQAKELWNHYKDELVFYSRNDKSDKAFYRQGEGVTMNILSDLRGYTDRDGHLLQKAGNTLFHEFGHHIDDSSIGGNSTWDYASNGIKLSNGKNLGKTVFDEINQRIKEQSGSRIIERKSNLRTALLEDHDSNPSSMSSISDLFGGATKNQLRIRMGHSKDYWEGDAATKRWLKYQDKKPADYRELRLGKEAFAEMYAADIMDPEEVEKFEKWLPESYSMYKELVTKLTGG